MIISIRVDKGRKDMNDSTFTMKKMYLTGNEYIFPGWRIYIRNIFCIVKIFIPINTFSTNNHQDYCDRKNNKDSLTTNTISASTTR